MKLDWKRNSRRLHRWGAILTAIPLLLVIVSGILLQVKKQVTWVQPATVSRGKADPAISWESVLAAVSSVPEAEVQSWSDIDRIDVRPSKGIAKVQCKNRWEIQVDMKTAEVVASNYRRSDIIESLHDGSFFSESAKLWLFLPNGLILLGLWFSGMYLWMLPSLVRWKKRSKQRSKKVAITKEMS